MRITKKTTTCLSLTLAMLFAASTFAADINEVKGQFVAADSRQNTIVMNVEVLGLAGAEKKAVNFNLAADAKWTVCLSGQCAEKTGIEGIGLVNEYATFEAYGITPKGCNITLEQTGNTITGVKVNLC